MDNFIVSQVERLEAQRLMVKQINIGMLQLRRNEKDFLARNDVKYLAKFEINALS